MVTHATHKYNVGLDNQRNVILWNLMTNGNINTVEIRELGFKTGVQRVHELRKQGWIIDTVFESYTDVYGNYYPRVARYYLRGAEYVAA